MGVVEAGQDEASAGVNDRCVGAGKRTDVLVGPGSQDALARDGEGRPTGFARPDPAIQDDDRGLADDAGDRSRLRTD
jgi:hypothetical protein